MAHSRPASDTAPRQIEIFEEEGVDLASVQIAHCGDSPDADYVERLLQKGIYVGLDRYGIEMYLPYDQRQTVAVELLERGYASQLFISADSCATIDWFPAEVAAQLAEAGMVKDWTIRIVPERVIPDLRERGVTEEQFEQMLVVEPGQLADRITPPVLPLRPGRRLFVGAGFGGSPLGRSAAR